MEMRICALFAAFLLAGSPALATVVGDLDKEMSREEIFLELVEDPGLDPAPKGDLASAPHELPLDEASLPVTPEARLRAMVPDHLYPYFDLYLYVNKADRGRWAQEMHIFQKTSEGTTSAPNFTPLHRWQVSTGRNVDEKPWTITPPGLFLLDPKRMFSKAYSSQFGVSMPYAMFFQYSYRHRKSGYAIHGVIPDYESYLGQRASAGCVRLYTPLAERLFTMIRSGMRGEVPVFPFDDEVGLTFRDGRVMKDEDGKVILQNGYKVLLIIDDQPGPVARGEGE